MLTKLTQGAMRWLARELEEQRVAAGAKECNLSPGARLLPEAEVNNFRRNREKISIGRHSYIRGRLLVYAHGGSISIGNWCYLGIRSEIWSMQSIKIGDRVLISHDVNIHDGTAHSMDPLERHQHFQSIIEKGHPTLSDQLPGVTSAPIVIEDDVWISFGVTILKGVRIGRGSIVAAGSIVTKDIPPGMIYRNLVHPIIESVDKIRS